MKASLKINASEFNSTLRRYLQFTSRDIATVLNTKAFFIARRATVLTPKANIASIRTDLGRIVRRRSGGIRAVGLTPSRRAGVSLAEAILRARIARRGEKQPGKAEMQRQIVSMLLARARSVAFLKSGWLPAIRRLAPLADTRGKPRADSSAAQIGAPKGGARAARPGFRSIVAIWNSAQSRHEARAGFARFGLPALQRAVNDEAQSMGDYIARKLSARARALGIKAKS